MYWQCHSRNNSIERYSVSILQRIFKPRQVKVEHAELVNGAVARFSSWNGDAYSSDIYRGAVDAIARNAAKLRGTHVVQVSEYYRAQPAAKLNRLLQVQPNPYMSAYDMIYKLVTHYYLFNNAFAYVQRNDRGGIEGIYPVGAVSCEFMLDAAETLYIKFYFKGGKTILLPYADVIHLRRNFNADELLGDSNSALIPTLELAHTQSEGMANSIKSSANIRGILKFTQLMSPDKLKEQRDRFILDYLSISNEGGVVATDQKMEYQPITVNPAIIDAAQLGAVQKKIYDYLGISESIVNSNYTENEFSAFYESILEPLAIQLSLEFTRKMFNEREQAYGNKILFENGMLQFASNNTKIKLISSLIPYGLLTINQALAILNLPGVEDGDRRFQTLNVVDAGNALDYQMAKAGGKKPMKAVPVDDQEEEEEA